jgi:hypothetical protein
MRAANRPSITRPPLFAETENADTVPELPLAPWKRGGTLVVALDEGHSGAGDDATHYQHERVPRAAGALEQPAMVTSHEQPGTKRVRMQTSATDYRG